MNMGLRFLLLRVAKSYPPVQSPLYDPPGLVEDWLMVYTILHFKLGILKFSMLSTMTAWHGQEVCALSDICINTPDNFISIHLWYHLKHFLPQWLCTVLPLFLSSPSGSPTHWKCSAYCWVSPGSKMTPATDHDAWYSAGAIPCRSISLWRARYLLLSSVIRPECSFYFDIC